MRVSLGGTGDNVVVRRILLIRGRSKNSVLMEEIT